MGDRMGRPPATGRPETNPREPKLFAQPHSSPRRPCLTISIQHRRGRFGEREHQVTVPTPAVLPCKELAESPRSIFLLCHFGASEPGGPALRVFCVAQKGYRRALRFCFRQIYQV
jgi:hypothetical protein